MNLKNRLTNIFPVAVVLVLTIFPLSAAEAAPLHQEGGKLCLEELVLLLLQTASPSVDFMFDKGYFTAQAALGEALLNGMRPGDIDVDGMRGILVHITEATVGDFNSVLQKSGRTLITDEQHLRQALKKLGAEIDERNSYAFFRATDFEPCMDFGGRNDWPKPPPLDLNAAFILIPRSVNYQKLPLAQFKNDIVSADRPARIVFAVGFNLAVLLVIAIVTTKIPQKKKLGLEI